MKELYFDLQKIQESSAETWQKIEMIVNNIFLFAQQHKKEEHLHIISTTNELKQIYSKESTRTKNWLALSNIDNWLSLDEERLQTFRKTLDENSVNVRIICKPQWIKHEPNGFKNREIKTLHDKYLLVSNIDILDAEKVIITTPWESHLGVYITDLFINNLLKALFYNLRNNNQYIVWVTSWDELSTTTWIDIMKSGNNFWIDYVINPVLYPEIFNHLSLHKKTTIIDFWCWINTLGLQLLYGIPSHVEGLKNINHIEVLRKNIETYIWFEANESFVEQTLKDVTTMWIQELQIIRKELIKNNPLPLKNASIDLCLSRNFIVHLNYEDFIYHISEAYRVLKPWGVYILATLNPGYEQKKYNLLTGSVLSDGERYNHYHGATGELGIRVQHYKTIQNLEKQIQEFFTIEKQQWCLPVNDSAQQKHPLYYDDDCPMGVVYTLVKNK